MEGRHTHHPDSADLCLEDKYSQTVTPPCPQTKQEVQSISKPKPKGMCQRDFITSQGVWASGALLHFDFRGGALLGLEVSKRQTFKRDFSKFCLGGMRRREESGTYCLVHGGSNYHSEGPFYYRRVSKLCEPLHPLPASPETRARSGLCQCSRLSIRDELTHLSGLKKGQGKHTRFLALRKGYQTLVHSLPFPRVMSRLRVMIPECGFE